MPCLLLLLGVLRLGAQTPRFEFGVTGGVALNKRTQIVRDESRRYTFGPVVEVSLVKPITVYVNPLYRRSGWSFGPTEIVPAAGQLILDTVRSRSHSLELPVIGKYSFRNTSRRWRPFVGSGFSFRTAWITSENRVIARDPETNALRIMDSKHSGRTGTDNGVVVSTGIAFRHGRIQFVPELRYTRWSNPNRHQGDFLFSIRF